MASKAERSQYEHWREQLMFADRVWRRHGLSREVETSSGRRSTQIMKLWRDMYRGMMEATGFGGMPRSEQHVSNIMFGTLNTLHAELAGTLPKVTVQPKGGTLAHESAERKARLNQALLQDHFNLMNFEREVSLAVLCALQERHAIVRHGFTPNLEEYAASDGRIMKRVVSHSPQMPWLQYKPNYETRIDPTANTFYPDGDARWVAFYSRLTEFEVTNSDRWIKRDGWMPTSSIGILSDEGLKNRSDEDIDPESHKLYEVWEVYSKETKEWYALSPGYSGGFVSEVREWEIDYGQLPYSFLQFNPNTDTPMGTPFPELIHKSADLYNKTWTIISAALNRTMRRVFVNTDAMGEEARHNLMQPESIMEFIEIQGDPKNVVKEIQIGQIDPQAPMVLGMLRDDIRETLGISSMNRGQRVNVETAAEAGQIARGAMVQGSRTQIRVDEFWQNIAKTTHAAMMQIDQPSPFYIPLQPGDGLDPSMSQDEVEQGWVRADIDELRGYYDYAVKPGSTRPVDPDEDLQKGLMLYGALGATQSTLLNQAEVTKELVRDAGKDVRKWVVDPSVAAPAEQALQEQGASPQPQGQQVDAGLLSVLGGGGQ